MLPEQENVFKERAHTRPPDFGLSVLIKPDKLNAAELLARLRDIWQVVAGWGRWSDENLGDWPSQSQCVASFPTWFTACLQAVPSFEIENWLQDLHDRNWIWWSGAVIDGFVKIDLNAESMPASFWMLKFAVEKIDGQVIYQDVWNDGRMSSIA
jgi:hypothetical protein